MQSSTALDALKILPSGAYVVATVGGLSLNEWAAVAALLYSVGMLGFLLWDRGLKPWLNTRKLAKLAKARRKRRKVVSRVVAMREADDE